MTADRRSCFAACGRKNNNTEALESRGKCRSTDAKSAAVTPREDTGGDATSAAWGTTCSRIGSAFSQTTTWTRKEVCTQAVERSGKPRTRGARIETRGF